MVNKKQKVATVTIHWTMYPYNVKIVDLLKVTINLQKVLEKNILFHRYIKDLNLLFDVTNYKIM